MESEPTITTGQFAGYCIDDEALDRLSPKLEPVFRDILSKESLDQGIVEQLKTIYIPLCAWIAGKHSSHPVVIGINGAQGSGKTTLSKILGCLLKEGFGKTTIQLSIDDLYYSRQKRKNLAETIHPLLGVRGVPGTHDVEKGINILDALVNRSEKNIHLPRFDKSTDDLFPEVKWIRVNEPVDIILFEGWCLGSIPENEAELEPGINELEEVEDNNMVWRNYVNRELAGPYQELFRFIDYLIMLKVPDMESIYEWRLLQENKLRNSSDNTGASGFHIMSDEEIRRFIMHFERITRHTLREMPGRADIVLELNKNHQVSSLIMNEKRAGKY